MYLPRPQAATATGAPAPSDGKTPPEGSLSNRSTNNSPSDERSSKTKGMKKSLMPGGVLICKPPSTATGVPDGTLLVVPKEGLGYWNGSRCIH